MTNPNPELLEIILRECAAAGSNPWYPGEYAQATGLPRESLESSLDQLRMAGLVQLTPWAQGHGQGYQLTPHGLEVLDHKKLLCRVRQGDLPEARSQPIAPSLERHALSDSRGEKIRAALLDDTRPIVTQFLMMSNVVWFLVGLGIFVLRYGGRAMEYLAIDPMGGHGNRDLSLTYVDLGSLVYPLVVDEGQWWRIFSCGFAHAGILHLGMNMYALYILGPLLERMWGRAAFLTIYLMSLVGGSAAALLFVDDLRGNTLGASGAICGLLGSMATWLFLNRNHLPPHIVSAWARNILTNVFLLVIISLLPGVSWQGHAGGGVTGAVVSAPLWLARFGWGPQRWLGWIGTAAIAIVGLLLTYAELKKAANAGSDPEGRAEVRAVERKVLPALSKADERAIETLSLEAKAFKSGKKGLEEAKAKEISDKLLTLHKLLEQDIRTLEKAGPFHQQELSETMKTGIVFLEASAKLAARTGKALASDNWPPVDLEQLRIEHIRIQELNKSFGRAWQKLKAFMDSP